MNYSCVIEIPDTDVYEILSPDMSRSYDRSVTTIEKKGDKVSINTKAKDYTAMRASATGVLKLIAVYDKLK